MIITHIYLIFIKSMQQSHSIKILNNTKKKVNVIAMYKKYKLIITGERVHYHLNSTIAN